MVFRLQFTNMFPACSRPSVPPAANAVSVAKHAREVKQIGGCAKVVISLFTIAVIGQFL